jgi:hypothetical protein
MASHIAKAAHRGDGGDLRKLTSGQEDASEHIEQTDWLQDRLVAVADKNKRTRFEARLVSFDAVRRATLSLREQNGIGCYRTSGPTLVFGPEHIETLLVLVRQLKVAAVEEGLL